jgi:hypothetical protein
MKKFFLAILAGTVLSVTAMAGWEHVANTDGTDGKTYWVNSPTPASCFIRNNTTKNVCPAISPLVYVDTIKIGTNTSVYSFGFFAVNSSGDYYLLANVGISDYLQKKNPGSRVDVEFDINSSGDVFLKP